MDEIDFIMAVVIYARYSSLKQNETSIEAQLDECYRYCKLHKLKVVGVYIDKAMSAKTDDRPDFLRMIEDSNKKLFQGIVVYQLDRFSRSREDSAHYKHKLKKNGVKVLSAREHISEDASGILVESVLEGMAEYYSAELSQKVKRNLKLNAEKGFFNGGYPPFGYKVGTVDCGTYKKRKLEPAPEIAPIVKEVFEMRADDTNLLDIVDFLNDKGYKTVMGNSFQKSSLENMFRNKRYIGTTTFDGVEYPNTMPAIIDEELFNRVQMVVQKYKHSPAIAKADEDYILTTKLFCGKCNATMVGSSGTSQNGTTYKYYVCSNSLKKKCNKKNLPKQLLEDLVVNECRKILTDENINMIADKVYSICQKENAQSCLLKALEKQIKKIYSSIENLMVALENGDNVDLINQRITDKRVELDKTKKQYDIESKKLVNLTGQQIKYFLLKLKDGNIDDIKYRKTLITLFINKIYVYDDKLTITFNVGENPLTVTKSLLKDINSNLKNNNSSYFEQSCPPNT